MEWTTEILEDTIYSDYFLLLKYKLSNVVHMEFQSVSALESWDIYQVMNTPYQFLIVTIMDPKLNKVQVTLEIDPDPEILAPEFNELANKKNIYSFIIDDPEKDNNKELKKGLKKQIRVMKKNAQKILLDIETKLKTGATRSDIILKYRWIEEDWIFLTNIIDIAEFNMSKIPKLLATFNIDDIKYVPKAVADVFLF